MPGHPPRRLVTERAWSRARHRPRRVRLDRLDEVNAVLIDWYGAPDEVARCVDVSDVERV